MKWYNLVCTVLGIKTALPYSMKEAKMTFFHTNYSFTDIILI